MIDFLIYAILTVTTAAALTATIIGVCLASLVLVAVVRDFLRGGRKE